MVSWQVILAAMLFLQPPGKSIYSRVEVEADSAPAIMAEIDGTKAFRLLRDGEEPPTQCLQPGNVACSKPAARDVSHNGVNLRVAYVRSETYDEGVVRYATIAQAISQELDEGAWTFPAGQSWRFLVTIAYHESGFRRDIHSGYGSAALGDCKWQGEIGKSKRLKNSCRSHGLFQTLFDPPQRRKILGFRGRDIVGTSVERTRRQVRVALSHLDRLHTYCSFHGPKPYKACVLASYGGGVSVTDPRIRRRVGTFDKIGRAPSALSEHVATLLGLDEASEPEELAVR